MHDARFMRCRESVCDLDTNVQNFTDRERRSCFLAAVLASLRPGRTNSFAQCFTINKLSSNEVAIIDVRDPVNRYDVWMIQA
jgi:hypothetical protein